MEAVKETNDYKRARKCGNQ